MTEQELIDKILHVLPETRVTRWRKVRRIHLPRKLGKIFIHPDGSMVCEGPIPPPIGEIIVDF